MSNSSNNCLKLQNPRTDEMDYQKIVNDQASEIASLKEQMAANELSWDQEKQKIMKALKSERERRKAAKAEKGVIEKGKEEIICSLRQTLLEKETESESLKKDNGAFRQNCMRKAHHVIFGMNKINVMECDVLLKTQHENFKQVRQTALDLESYVTQKDSELIQSEAEWKIKLTALEDRMRSELAAKESFHGQQDLQGQSREMEEEWRNQKEAIKLLTQQNADLQVQNVSLQELAQQTNKEKAQFEKEEKMLRQTILDLESYALQKDSELTRSEAEWEIKLTALEDRMSSELAAKEESFQREQDLQKRCREMEEEWCNQKEAIKLLKQQNTDLQVHNISLQELAQQTDKEKAQFKKEEKKARKEAEKTLKKDSKEAEKMLKKDRKEEEEREKKEKKENEKREKEELKRQKKETKENEKRQKKEKKLMEKKEKE